MKCVLVLDNIRSVENVGSIFRTAESFGVEKVVLVGITPAPVDRFGRKRKDLAKVALGREDRVLWEKVEDVLSIISLLKDEDYQILALEQDKRSVRLRDFKAEEKFALIVGNEVEGISKSVLDQVDKILEIPMTGESESLNVSVATGVALFHLCN